MIDGWMDGRSDRSADLFFGRESLLDHWVLLRRLGLVQDLVHRTQSSEKGSMDISSVRAGEVCQFLQARIRDLGKVQAPVPAGWTERVCTDPADIVIQSQEGRRRRGRRRRAHVRCF